MDSSLSYFKLNNLEENDWENETLVAKSMSRTYKEIANKNRGEKVVVEAAVGSGILSNYDKFSPSEIEDILEE